MSQSKPIFVISDLHIGDGGPRDNFAVGGRPAEFHSFLDYVANEGGELIIVGDLFEFWQASLSKVIVRNLPLVGRMAELTTTYILGNHDADLKAFIGRDMLAHPLFRKMSGPFRRTIGGRTFKFMHGHEVDPYNSGDAPGWGRMMAIFAGICEDKHGSPMLGDQPLEKWLTRAGEWVLTVVANGYARLKGDKVTSAKRELTPAQNLDRAAEMLIKYAADKKSEGYDVAVVGHTHQPGQIGNWYINAGSWATTANNFVRISPQGEVFLYDWQNAQPVMNGTTLSLPEDPTATGAAVDGP